MSSGGIVRENCAGFIKGSAVSCIMFCIKARFSGILVKSSFRTFNFSRTMSMLVEKVSFASENAKGECPGVFVKGKDSSSSRGLIVLQEWWGMNQQIQDQAKEIAEKGDFVALVPDLYRGKVATDHETAGHYMNDLDWPGAIQDITGIYGGDFSTVRHQMFGVISVVKIFSICIMY